MLAGVVFEGELSSAQRQALTNELLNRMLGAPADAPASPGGASVLTPNVRVLSRHDMGKYVHVFSHIRCVGGMGDTVLNWLLDTASG